MPKTRLTAALCSRKNETASSSQRTSTAQLEPFITQATEKERAIACQQVLEFEQRLPSQFCSSDFNLHEDTSCTFSSSDSDSEQDLPEVYLHPQESKQVLEKGDAVWVKYRNHNFWPSLVLQNNPKTKKLRILFLDGKDSVKHGEKIYMKYNRKVIVPFSNENRKQFEASGKSIASEDLRHRFQVALNKMDDYLTKRALGITGFTNFFNDSSSSIDDADKINATPQPEHGEEEEMDIVPPKSRSKAVRKPCLTPDERREQRKTRNKPMVDYIRSHDMKEYLVKIWKGQAPSDRHLQFQKGPLERKKLQDSNFGPFDDDEQLETILFCLGEWLKEISMQKIPDMDYLFGVWIPEAIVKAISKTKRCGQQKAWEIFHRGVKLTKSEKLEFHQLLTDNK